MATALLHGLKRETSKYITQAAAFTCALAFNTAMKSTIDYYLPYKGSGVLGDWIYAVAIIIILLVVVYIFTPEALLDEETASAAAAKEKFVDDIDTDYIKEDPRKSFNKISRNRNPFDE